MINFKTIAYSEKKAKPARRKKTRRRVRKAISKVSETPLVKWDGPLAFKNAQMTDPFWLVYFSQTDWDKYNLSEYFLSHYSPRELEDLILGWVERIRRDFAAQPFYVGNIVWNMIKLLPADIRNTFILDHRHEVGYVINKLICSEEYGVDIPAAGFLDAESTIVGSFGDVELARLVDGFVFPLRDVVVYLLNNPDRAEVLSHMGNQTLRDIIEFNMDILRAQGDKDRIRELVTVYGGNNVPDRVREKYKGEKRSNIPSLSQARYRERLYKITPLLALAEVVLFDGLVVAAVAGLRNPREILDLINKKGLGERLEDLFNSHFYYNRWPLIVYLVHKTDPVIFDMVDILRSTLGRHVARYFTDEELVALFTLDEKDIRNILKEDEGRLRNVITLRASYKDRRKLVAIAHLQRAYERQGIRDIRRIHFPMLRKIEATAILLLQGVELTEGKPDVEPDILSVRNACRVLGVSVDDSVEDIRRIYRSLQFIFHPDRVGEGEVVVSRMVNMAVEIIEKYFQFNVREED